VQTAAPSETPAPGSRRIPSLWRAALWSLTWSLGVALGVALGGWLTVASGSGAPGTESLNVVHDLLVVPGLSGLAVFVVVLSARLAFGFFRRRST
jgi:hypothetical protein